MSRLHIKNSLVMGMLILIFISGSTSSFSLLGMETIRMQLLMDDIHPIYLTVEKEGDQLTGKYIFLSSGTEFTLEGHSRGDCGKSMPWINKAVGSLDDGKMSVLAADGSTGIGPFNETSRDVMIRPCMHATISGIVFLKGPANPVPSRWVCTAWQGISSSSNGGLPIFRSGPRIADCVKIRSAMP